MKERERQHKSPPVGQVQASPPPPLTSHTKPEGETDWPYLWLFQYTKRYQGRLSMRQAHRLVNKDSRNGNVKNSGWLNPIVDVFGRMCGSGGRDQKCGRKDGRTCWDQRQR
ncbi:hypothetical protein SKAU_G00257840 [Synaphobranchus kaupii]|uniref:Uncharacterized protein n=1 Tax=Synaphobranchus kaupii TaxID=118154 RepID=A0A9Q1F456_SYNKA|nr:hypothetical protein SKAU_G00257840 [Synaphobranchus kaupii]